MKLNPSWSFNPTPPLMLMNDLWVGPAVVWCRFSGLPSRGPWRANLLIGIGVQSVGFDNKPEDKTEQSVYSDGLCSSARVRICEPLLALKRPSENI